jgi:predicted membrane protein
MRNQGQLVFAVILIAIGILFLIGNITDVDVWQFWPLFIILLGLWLLLRPRLVGSETAGGQKLLGDIRRRGTWQVSNQEFWTGIGDIKLDLTDAQIPEGESTLNTWSLIGSARLVVPADVGVSISSSALIGDVRFMGRKRDIWFTSVKMRTDDYQTAARKIELRSGCLIGDVRVKRA